MRFEIWEPVYEEILHDFGFTRKRDEEACRLLSDLLIYLGRSSELAALKARDILGNRSVIVCGNAPSLEREIEDVARSGYAFMAADGATSVLLRKRIRPDIIVTDLDGNVEDIKLASRGGSIVAVHAHGDNIDALRSNLAGFKEVIGTVQCRPVQGVYNFGGFTDGDRCVFLARGLGVPSSGIRLIGFDYDDPGVTPRKSKKLQWARRLVSLALEE